MWCNDRRKININMIIFMFIEGLPVKIRLTHHFSGSNKAWCLSCTLCMTTLLQPLEQACPRLHLAITICMEMYLLHWVKISIFSFKICVLMNERTFLDESLPHSKWIVSWKWAWDKESMGTRMHYLQKGSIQTL